MIIAIDGPAASGKGTLARRLAAHFHLRHLDTGLTYRAVAAALLQKGAALDDEAAAVRAAEETDFSRLDPSQLSSHKVGEAASKVASLRRVRTILVARQQAFAKKPPGAVLDGRDIATAVCPQADVKLFITADVEARAKRRAHEMAAKGETACYDAVLLDLTRRDARDRDRTVSPFIQALDAVCLDTTALGIEEAFSAALKIVKEKTGRS